MDEDDFFADDARVNGGWFIFFSMMRFRERR